VGSNSFPKENTPKLLHPSEVGTRMDRFASVLFSKSACNQSGIRVTAIGRDAGRSLAAQGPKNPGAASARQRTAVSTETVPPMGFLRGGKTGPETGSGLYRENR